MPKRTKKSAESSERVCPFCLFMDTMHAAMDDFRDSNVGKHVCNAEREVLLAMRAAIDECIDACGGKDKKDGSRIQKVKVE